MGQSGESGGYQQANAGSPVSRSAVLAELHPTGGVEIENSGIRYEHGYSSGAC